MAAVALLASVGLSAFAYYLFVVPQASSPCSTTSSTVIPPKPGIQVLLLQPGSTATLCVKYSGAGLPNAGGVNLQLAVAVETCSKNANNVTDCSETRTSGVVVTPSPKGKHVDNRTAITVAFTIKADRNSTGRYLLSLPYSCPALAMAVGYEPSQLKISDFPGAQPIPCPFQGVQIEIVGVSGASTTHLGY